MLRFDGELFHPMAELNTPRELNEFLRRRGSFRPQPGSVLEQITGTNTVAHIEDDAARPTPGAPAKLGGARSTLGVPMLKDNKLVGAFVIYRQEVRPFTRATRSIWCGNFRICALLERAGARTFLEVPMLKER